MTKTKTGWWFGTFFIFPYIGKNHPNWLSYFSEGWPNHQPEKHIHYFCFSCSIDVPETTLRRKLGFFRDLSPAAPPRAQQLLFQQPWEPWRLSPWRWSWRRRSSKTGDPSNIWWMAYPLINVNVKNYGLHHHFDWGNTRKKWPFSIAMWVYQMVDCRNFHVMLRIESKINRHRPLLSLNARLMSVHVPLFCYGDCEAIKIIILIIAFKHWLPTYWSGSYHNLSTGNLHSEPTIRG